MLSWLQTHAYMSLELSPFVHHFVYSDEMILFNTLNKSIIRTEVANFDNLSFSGTEDDAQILLKLGFLVDNRDKEWSRFLESAKIFVSNESLKIHFLPTTRCNCRCYYCFENSLSRQAMSKNVLDSSLVMVERYILSNNINSIEVELFGGEPLTEMGIVCKFLDSICKLCDKLGIIFNLSMTTNGYLLNEENCRLLIGYGLSHVQITLDGDRKFHDSIRFLVSGAPTFDTIISNIHKLKNLDTSVIITLRLNYSKNNLSHVKEAIHFLKDEFEPGSINLTFAPITGSKDSVQDDYDVWAHSHMELYRYAREIGFVLPHFYTYCGMCVPKLLNSFVISPDGKLYKCTELMEDAYDSMTVDRGYIKHVLFNIDKLSECYHKQCPFVPLCYGGCIAHSKNGVTEMDCHIDLIRNINEQLIIDKLHSVTNNNLQ